MRHRGALVFPGVPDVPFDLYRSTLYTADELYDGLDRGYDHTLDARVYAWSRRSPGPRADVAHTLATAPARPRDRRRAPRVRPGSPGRRGHGRPRPAARHRGVRRRGEAGSRPGRARAWSSRPAAGPGAMEAANLGRPRERRSTSTPSTAAWPGSRDAPDVDHVTPWARAALRGRRGPPGGRRADRGHARDADLVLRPRAAEPLRHVGGEVLRATRPRGRRCSRSAAAASSSSPVPPAPCRRCSRTPARTTTRHRGSARPMVLVGTRALDRAAAHLAAAAAAGRGVRLRRRRARRPTTLAEAVALISG